MNYKEKVAMMNKEAEESKSKALAKLQEDESRRVAEELRILEQSKVSKSDKKEKK